MIKITLVVPILLTVVGCADPRRFDALKPEQAMVQLQSGGQSVRGFFVSTDGVIATVKHGVDESKPITVTFPNGRTLPATLINSNKEADVAMVKVEAPMKGQEFKVLHLNDEDAEPGMHVRTITSAGVVHGTFEQWDEFGRIIDFTIPVKPTDIGAPLVADDGRVIGIVVGSDESHSRAAPAWQALRLMPKLAGRAKMEDDDLKH